MTQAEYNVAKQQSRELYYKFSLLNYKFQKVDELYGVVLNSSWSISSTSDIRRTGTIALTPDNETAYKVQSGSKIWMDKYVQVHIGIKDYITDKVVYTNMGIYLVNNPSQTYNAVDNTITLQLVDLMANITGLRKGNVTNGFQVPRNSKIKDVLIDTLKLCGFTKYVIQIEKGDYTKTQYDININMGQTYFDLLKALNDMNINYQMYFDVNGVFHYERVPTGDNEQLFVTDDLWKDVYISHTINTNYDNVKNHIIVLGGTHDTQGFGEAKISQGIYKVKITSVDKMRNNLLIGVYTPNKTISNPKLQLNNASAYPIVNEDGSSHQLGKEGYYVLRYNSSMKAWVYLSEELPYGEAQENNSRSPFYVKGSIGKISLVLQGGEYDNISTDNLARQRAEWELYTKCKLQNNVTIESVPLYWLDVNKLIEITFPNESKPQQYIVTDVSISGDLAGTQNIQAMKYYPFYDE